ncbi:hypothetical protein [Phenylobacterium sp.]|uniref:hypothetical protein n=1 Tax=Phenylobacterium sp. TaxID=1871053 RepID=UPI0035B2CF6C
MARKEDPRVTDLARYRRAREQARRRPPPPPTRPQSANQPLLGSRRNAGLILVLVLIVLAALWVGPMFL